VLESAVLALSTLASALYTAACAEATVPAGEVELLPADEPLPAEALDAPAPPPALVDVLEVVVLGAVVELGAVEVCFGVVVVVVVFGGEVVVVVVVVVWVVGFVVVSETNSVVPVADPVSRLAAVVFEAPLVSAVLRLSSAAVRF
jgi:hypothetical protein